MFGHLEMTDVPLQGLRYQLWVLRCDPFEVWVFHPLSLEQLVHGNYHTVKQGILVKVVDAFRNLVDY